jgi:uncharacterized membrane protein YphA (DoxX/SURF4 family)
MGSAWGLLLLRAVVGLVFVVHGGQKLFGFGLAGTAGFLGSLGIPLPTIAAAGLIAAELLGGLALLLGAWTRIAALLLAADMLVAMLTVHLRGGFFVPDGVRPGRRGWHRPPSGPGASAAHLAESTGRVRVARLECRRTPERAPCPPAAWPA